MNIHTINKDKHYDDTFFSSFPHLFQKEFKKTIQFNVNCKYDIGTYNQSDCNKLFGAEFGFLGVHHDSARFGWWYNPTKDKMILTAYCYVKGVRVENDFMNTPTVAEIELGKDYTCSIKIAQDSYVFEVKDGDTTVGQVINVPHKGVIFFGWTVSLYWGGTTLCPHLMTVFM